MPTTNSLQWTTARLSGAPLRSATLALCLPILLACQPDRTVPTETQPLSTTSTDGQTSTASPRSPLDDASPGCFATRTVTEARLRTALQTLTQRKIYFGHQSVGANILQGLDDLARTHRIPLSISVWTQTPLDNPGFYHALNGTNEDPRSKIRAFTDSQTKLGASAQFAFFKFCYIDFVANTNEEALFAQYQAAFAELRSKYPKTQYVHVTTPLTVVQTGAKAWFKGLAGKTPYGAKENAVRHRFNERLRQAYCGKEPLFDLARIESTRTDQGFESYRFEGKNLPKLVAAYTDDGQHLNGVGQRIVASQLALFLADLKVANE